MGDFNTRLFRTILTIQALYYFGTGLWGLLHIDSFVAVTGPKFDIWLVRTVSALIVAEGAGFFLAAVRREINVSILSIAILSAFGLMIIDLYYSSIDRISDVYLGDALAQILILIAFLVAFVKRSKTSKT